jgi:hypothetical protein
MKTLMLTAVAVVLALSGCSAPKSRIHGKVTYQGKPAAGATVILLASDNRTYPADVRADGTYDLPAVPRGPIRVSIQAALPRVIPRPEPGKGRDAFAKAEASADDAGKAARLPPPIPGIPIPAKYGDPDRSELSFELAEPDQERSFDLG